MIEDLVEKVLRTRAAYIEMLAAAFLKETGLKASESMLVEEKAGNQIRWYFKKREDFEASKVVIIRTCRSGDYENQARKFLIDSKIPFDFINENPLFDTGSRKIFAHVYYDDRNE